MLNNIIIKNKDEDDKFKYDSSKDFLDQNVSSEAKLILAIFDKNSALHDGAMIIENERIKAAGCVLPLSYNPDLDPNLGTRHRAGLGISERCDAIVVIVSEETGGITICRDGKLSRNYSKGCYH